MRTLPKPRPVLTVDRVVKVQPAPTTAPPLHAHSGPSGLSGLVGMSGPSGLSHLSGLSGLLQLEAQVSRRGVRSEGMALGELLEDSEDLPEGRLLRRLPSVTSLPWVKRGTGRPTEAGAGFPNASPELRKLIERMRRDGVSLAAVATRLRGWACHQPDVEQVAVSHTGCRYVVAVGLSRVTPERMLVVRRVMEMMAARFNQRSPSVIVLGPFHRRSPHFCATDVYRVWPA